MLSYALLKGSGTQEGKGSQCLGEEPDSKAPVQTCSSKWDPNTWAVCSPLNRLFCVAHVTHWMGRQRWNASEVSSRHEHGHVPQVSDAQGTLCHTLPHDSLTFCACFVRKTCCMLHTGFPCCANLRWTCTFLQTFLYCLQCQSTNASP